LSSLFALTWLPNHQGLIAVAIGAVGALIVTFIRYRAGNAGHADSADVEKEVAP
jgi:membrane protease YdiL (CAAX protease family)